MSRNLMKKQKTGKELEKMAIKAIKCQENPRRQRRRSCRRGRTKCMGELRGRGLIRKTFRR